MTKWDIIKATCNSLNIYSFTAEALEKLMEAVRQEAKREWVGLTDEEILDEYRQCYGDDGTLTDCYFARAIIIRFKGKNGG